MKQRKGAQREDDNRGQRVAQQVSGVRITWPDSQVESLPAIDANRTITVEQGKGVVRNVARGS